MSHSEEDRAAGVWAMAELTRKFAPPVGLEAAKRGLEVRCAAGCWCWCAGTGWWISRVGQCRVLLEWGGRGHGKDGELGKGVIWAGQ